MSEFNLGDKQTSKPSSTKLPKPVAETPHQKTLTLPTQPVAPSINPQEQLTDSSIPPNGGSNPDAQPDFDNAPLPEDESKPAVQVGEGAEGKITATGRMTYEVFDQTFCAIFSVSGHFTGFQTLIHAAEQPTRPDATRAIYETILDTPALHFLLEPKGLWMQRALAIGAFAVPVVLGVAGEMRVKQSPPAQRSNAAPETQQNDQKSMRDALKGRA